MTRSVRNRRIVCWVLAASEAAVLGGWIVVAWGRADPSSWGPILLTVVAATLAMSSFHPFRKLLRVLAGLHAVVAILAVRVYIESLTSPEPQTLAAYLVLNVTLPAMVVGLLPVRIRDAVKPDLPLGYEHLDPERHRLSPLERLVLILGMTLAIPTFMMGGVFLTVVWVPVAFAAYWLVRMLRTRRPAISGVGRHVRIEPQRQYPGQTKSYWTVNTADFRDDREPDV